MVEEGPAGNNKHAAMNVQLNTTPGKQPHLLICALPCGLGGVWWLTVDSITAVRRGTLYSSYLDEPELAPH